MPRKGRHWSEYPKMFHEALDTFRNDPNAMEWKRQVSRKDAFSLRTQFYRFCDCIREEWRKSDDTIRENTGLNSAYHWANNLIISATQIGEWWFVRLRKTPASDPEVRTPPEVRERIRELSRKITQNETDRREGDLQKIVGDWTKVEPTTTDEQLRAEAAAAGSTMCPLTELPCRRKCESICIKSGEAIQKAAAPPSLGL